jgi:hypothetical protein
LINFSHPWVVFAAQASQLRDPIDGGFCSPDDEPKQFPMLFFRDDAAMADIFCAQEIRSTKRGSSFTKPVTHSPTRCQN